MYAHILPPKYHTLPPAPGVSDHLVEGGHGRPRCLQRRWHTARVPRLAEHRNASFSRGRASPCDAQHREREAVGHLVDGARSRLTDRSPRRGSDSYGWNSLVSSSTQVKKASASDARCRASEAVISRPSYITRRFLLNILSKRAEFFLPPSLLSYCLRSVTASL